MSAYIRLHICNLIYHRRQQRPGNALALDSSAQELVQEALESATQSVVDARLALKARCMCAGCWSVLQCVAVCCSVLQFVAVCCGRAVVAQGCCMCAGCCRVLQCVAVCCSVLHCIAVCCSVLLRVAVLQYDEASAGYSPKLHPVCFACAVVAQGAFHNVL